MTHDERHGASGERRRGFVLHELAVSGQWVVDRTTDLKRQIESYPVWAVEFGASRRGECRAAMGRVLHAIEEELT